MITLALEFSSAVRSVAVAKADATSGRSTVLGKASDQTDPKSRPLVLIERALEAAAIRRDEIECVVVGLGPGSYTGIRSAIAVAQGWQLGRDLRLLGLGSIESIAAQAQARGWNGRISVMIDAQRNEFYFAAYEITANERREIQPLRLASLEDVRQLVRNASGHSNETLRPGEAVPRVIGPEVTKWFPHGDVIYPDATALAFLAEGRTDFVSGEQLEPIYLRAPSFVKAPPPRPIPPV